MLSPLIGFGQHPSSGTGRPMPTGGNRLAHYDDRPGVRTTPRCRTLPPSTSAALRCRRSRRRWGSRTCSSRASSPRPVSRRIGMTSPWSPCSACSACGSSRPPARTSPISARSTVTGCCGCAAKAARSSWSRCRQRSAARSTAPPAAGRGARSCSTPAVHGWTGTPPPGGCGGSRAMCRSPPDMLIRGPRCVMTGRARTWTATQLHPGRLHGLRHLNLIGENGQLALRGDARRLPNTVPPGGYRGHHAGQGPRLAVSCG